MRIIYRQKVAINKYDELQIISADLLPSDAEPTLLITFSKVHDLAASRLYKNENLYEDTTLCHKD